MWPGEFHHGVERCRVGDRHLAEHFAIQFNSCCDQGWDESVVADAAHFHSGAEARDPKLAEVALLLAAIAVGVPIGAMDEFECGAILGHLARLYL